MKNKKLYLLTLSYISLLLIIFFIMSSEKNLRIEQFVDSKVKQYTLSYDSIYHQYHQRADIIFNSNINNKEILKLFKNRDREKLYSSLKDSYKIFSRYNLKQLHFHLPNNDSFLRFHRPSKFGDNLTNVRETVSYVNKIKKPIDGFEEGRIFNGYRFVYPLFEDDLHLGSVEISFSAYAMVDEIMSHFEAVSNFIISKKAIDKKVFEDEKSNYTSSIFPGFYYEKSIIDRLKTQKNFKDITLTKDIIEKTLRDLELKKPFAIYNNQDTKLEVIIPVLNPVSKDLVAAVIIESNSDYIVNKSKNFLVVYFTVSVLISLIFFAFYKQIVLNTKLYAVLDEASSGIAMIDENGNFLEVNNKYCELMGYSKNEFKNINCIDLSTQEYMEKSKDMLETVKREGYVSRVRKACRAKSGDIVNVEISINKLPIVNRYVVVANPLDDKIALEELNNTLNQKVNEQVKKLRTQDKMLIQQSKLAAMGEMIDAVAHQWKQPLGVVKLSASELEYLYEYAKDELTQEFTYETSKRIQDQINHLVETIDEFRGFFRPKENLESVNIKKLVDSTLLLLKDELVKHTIKTTYHGDENIDISLIPNEFKHVIINIVNNAKDQFISKKIEDKNIDFYLSKDENSITFKICDNAGGIPKELIPKMFDANVTTKEEDKGTGIGLYISKNIIEKLHGTIEASNENGGACFTIALPLS